MVQPVRGALPSRKPGHAGSMPGGPRLAWVWVGRTRRALRPTPTHCAAPAAAAPPLGSNEGQVVKTLRVSPAPQGGSFFLNLSVTDKASGKAQFSTPLTAGEARLVRRLMEASGMGWGPEKPRAGLGSWRPALPTPACVPPCARPCPCLSCQYS